MEGVYAVTWPRGSRRATPGLSCAPRLDSLEGKTVCEAWNGVFRGDEIFPMIEKELRRRYQGIRFVGYDRFGLTGGGEGAKAVASLPERLREYSCDAVISGVGG
ncbi:MAG: hypothetical protein HYX90_11015 [Chloroflexi bacterium]|nr:hypothetical protein [Chloroflexota bacterium]